MANLGHGPVPQPIQDAVIKQMNSIASSYGGLSYSEIRGRLCKLLAELNPADLNGFVITSGGADSVECAIRIARRFTNKKIILSLNRAYHGSSTSALKATGDPRKWFGHGENDILKFQSTNTWMYQRSQNYEENINLALAELEEQIMYEGSQNIAAIIMEPIAGAGGAQGYPQRYMQGIRQICNKNDILLIFDEVMVGIGRTGNWFSYQMYEGVVPDICTMAKGLTAGYLPLGCVAMRQKIKDYFETVPLGWGITYAFNPISMACSYATLKYMMDKNILENVNKQGVVLKNELQKLLDEFTCVRQARSYGLFSAFDIQNPQGYLAHKLHEVQPKPVQNFKKYLVDKGLMLLWRSPSIHSSPCLTVKEETIKEGFEILRGGLQYVEHWQEKY